MDYELMEKLVEMVDGIQFNAKDFEGQEMDTNKIEWYVDRFNLFKEDGVLDAIQPYLNKLLTDDVNDLTRLVIMHEAMKLQFE